MRVVVIATILLAAGCTSTSPQEPPESVSTPAFNGAAAYDFVAGLVTEDGEPRYRHPGSPGHASAADWLENAMQGPGWSVSRQTFSGADYLATDRGATSAWNDSCGEMDQQEVADFAFHNLIATSGQADPMVWLGAHWESKEDAYDSGHVLGANDGASGVGLLLQFMRHVSPGEIQVPFGVGIVFFDGEDGFEDCHPLAGSTYFVENAEAGLVDRFILLDMVGDENARFPREANSRESDPALVELIWTHGAKYAPDSFTDAKQGVTDDHIPFVRAGIPAVDVIDFARGGYGFPPYWHTSNDTMENISSDMLEAVGNTIWATLVDPEFVASWPGVSP